MKGPRAFVRTIVAAALLFGPDGRAEPSRWDRARDPARMQAERALVTALHARWPDDIPIPSLEDLPAYDGLLALHAATLLELAGGESLPSAEVWYFLGDALVVADRGRDEDGRRILRKALAAAPSSPEAAQAFENIAIASNRLRDFQGEREAYGEQLALEWDRNKRATLHMNRGEASMSLGELAVAREDYLTALALTDESEIHALAAWGLAVALARDDDLPEALPYAWEASQMRFQDAQGNPITALELPTVFFTPPYEIFYYRALAGMAASEHAGTPVARKNELEWALAQLRRFSSEARTQGDRWLKNAEYQMLWCERRLAQRR